MTTRQSVVFRVSGRSDEQVRARAEETLEAFFGIEVWERYRERPDTTLRIDVEAPEVIETDDGSYVPPARWVGSVFAEFTKDEEST